MDILETRATLCTRHKEDKTIQKLKNEDELQTTEHIRTNQIHYTEKHTAKRENEKKEQNTPNKSQPNRYLKR